ncbi:MAG: hypothetical protein DME54_07750 [Verrucomicrobia bacterium]|nr:MAG: hypothetical protein DMF09_03325 [Verrucomicrobiota bacterium]PYJ95073.1 MAG: hypothetical protein DME62_01880 [Verrucomicrobiota bacterium]PYK34624.1 MAG: hypothetical protein DME54_07750 [Verrucomicrobiota bacterium]PYL21482.1 MAG: hypothetical protein DMF41_02360 [Verrucomicrobiota bacterium]PYL81782.1 MAG: hypothetical protein DMF21_04015 [Verrucomicrobiota bacterium]
MVRKIARKQQNDFVRFKVGKFALQKYFDSGNLALCEDCSRPVYRFLLLCLPRRLRIRKASWSIGC